MVVGGLKLSAVSRSNSMRQQVTDALKAALISGEMRPGVLYPAPALAEMLGVSATPVREAMLDLVREGLVTVERNKGFRVTKLTARELDELVETRLLLEVPVMGAITEAIRPETARALEELRETASALETAALNQALVDYIQLDMEFHSCFLALHGNDQIVRTVRSLRERSRLYGLKPLSDSQQLVKSTREHGEMIDLALAGDRVMLENLVRVHIGHVRTDWADDPKATDVSDGNATVDPDLVGVPPNAIH